MSSSLLRAICLSFDLKISVPANMLFTQKTRRTGVPSVTVLCRAKHVEVATATEYVSHPSVPQAATEVY